VTAPKFRRHAGLAANARYLRTCSECGTIRAASSCVTDFFRDDLSNGERLRTVPCDVLQNPYRNDGNHALQLLVICAGIYVLIIYLLKLQKFYFVRLTVSCPQNVRIKE